jgi:hypothetical protein
LRMCSSSPYLYDIEGTDSTRNPLNLVKCSFTDCLDFVKVTDSTLDSFRWETENFNWANAKFPAWQRSRRHAEHLADL